jgi:hypothetical protein
VGFYAPEWGEEVLIRGGEGRLVQPDTIGMKQYSETTVGEARVGSPAPLHSLHAEIEALRRTLGGAAPMMVQDLAAPVSQSVTERADLLDLAGATEPTSTRNPPRAEIQWSDVQGGIIHARPAEWWRHFTWRRCS